MKLYDAIYSLTQKFEFRKYDGRFYKCEDKRPVVDSTIITREEWEALIDFLLTPWVDEEGK